MLVIIVTVVTQGAIVDSELRGNLKGLLFVNDGFFQAVGVISFGMVLLRCIRLS
jgi:sodium-coupled neutral amino acid transporter 11